MDNFFDDKFDSDSDELLAVFDELPLWSAPFGIKLLDTIVLKKNISALDIGFGAGFPLTEIAMRLGKTSKVCGIDTWDAAIRRTNKKLKIYKIDNVEIIKGEAENIPLSDNSIDLITSNNGINNVSDLDKSLNECYRVMKKGAQFVQTMNLPDTMIEFYNILEGILIKRDMLDQVDIMKQHIYDRRKPLDEFSNILKNHLFEVRSVVLDKFEYNFVDGNAMFDYFPIRFYFLSSWKDIVPKDQILSVYKEVVSEINKISEEKGSFKLTIPFAVIDSYKQ